MRTNVHNTTSQYDQRRTRGANIARGLASECRGPTPKTSGSAGTGCLVEAARAIGVARATRLPVGLCVVVLLALALIASISPARADTLDIYTGKQRYRYEGTVLVVDQAGLAALVGFDAQTLSVTKRAPPSHKRPPIKWFAVIGSNSGVAARDWNSCRQISIVYAESSSMHVSLECTEVFHER
ncbi:MAG TPA: hypothetical protein VLF18_08580 [Tahibacter sp.]|uniref:hypothetical protein n=1 Tax=Tahibacter sp. TaxID=2056211 RepID=UPI002B82C20E|nr:hypothetical protein [Tahibacter sp.]HSX60239.1 hypothetical protein [Tahibacter sp.]